MKVPKYVVYPLLGLINRWPIKLPVSVGIAVLWDFLVDVGQVSATLFDIDPILAGMAVALYLADWITGLGRAIYEHGLQGVRSDEFRHAGWKCIEYGGVVTVCVVLSNGLSHTWAAPIASPVNVAGWAYVGLTEGFSVWENVTRSDSGAGRVMMSLQDLASGDWEKFLERRRDRKQNGGQKNAQHTHSRPPAS